MDIDIVFEGSPGPVAPTFVEVENMDGASIRVGTWIDRGNGLWALRIPLPDLNDYAAQSHEDNAKWWVDPATGKPIERNRAELLMLMVSELAEAMEGERKDLMDDKLPHRKMAEVELADAIIRIGDYAAAFGYDLEGAYQEKRAYNKTRADHALEVRAAAGGKRF